MIYRYDQEGERWELDTGQCCKMIHMPLESLMSKSVYKQHHKFYTLRMYFEVVANVDSVQD